MRKLQTAVEEKLATTKDLYYQASNGIRLFLPANMETLYYTFPGVRRPTNRQMKSAFREFLSK